MASRPARLSVPPAPASASATASATASAIGVLVIDDRGAEPDVWQQAAARMEPPVVVRRVDTASSLQRALLEGGWQTVLARRSPKRLSLNAILEMVQVLEPAPAVVLMPDDDGAGAAARWLEAATRVAAPTAYVRPADQFTLDLGESAASSSFASSHASSLTSSRATASRVGAASSTADADALRALRNSEERFRTLTEIAPVGIFLTDPEQRCVYVNGRWSEITGVTAREAEGLDWRVCLQTTGATLEATALFAEDPTTPVAFENPLEHKGRPTTWVIGQFRPYRDARGDIVGHLGVITDITERKQAELAMQESERRLRELSTHMNAVEERQRADIAREIHDDIGSALTGMKIDVLRIKQLTTQIPEAQEKLAMFTRLLDSTSAASVRIAKALRPSILDDGLVPAIDWQCREFAKRYEIDVEFVEPEQEPKLKSDQSTALFRVVQEALNNVAKHAQAKNVDVVLFARANELTLEIRDNGRGLPRDKPTERIERSGGFGITGMRERVLSLGGWMDVTGAPGRGTTVMVGIPIHGKPRAVA